MFRIRFFVWFEMVIAVMQEYSSVGSCSYDFAGVVLCPCMEGYSLPSFPSSEEVFGFGHHINEIDQFDIRLLCTTITDNKTNFKYIQ